MSEKQNQELNDKIRKIERNYAFVRDLILALERVKGWADHSSPAAASAMRMAAKEIEEVIEKHVE